MEIPGQNAQTAEEKSRLEKITGPHQIEMESWISCAPYEQLLHMKIVEALDGKAILTMPFSPDQSGRYRIGDGDKEHFAALHPLRHYPCASSLPERGETGHCDCPGKVNRQER
jgi:hypothetical protein